MNTERVWTIGSAADCDIHVASPTVSGRHCRLTRRGQSFIVEDLGSTNGTYVAGQRITQPRVVRAGETITLGQQTPMPWPDLSTATIGRLPDNDIVVPLDTVSSHHARLERRGGRVYLIDLESRNGTSLNDPLNKINSTELRSGDVVFLGTHRISADELLTAVPADMENQLAGGQRTQFEGAAPVLPASPRAAGSAKAPASAGIPAWAIAAGAAGVVVLLACVLMFLFAGPKTQNATAQSDPPPQQQQQSPTNATAAIATHPHAEPIVAPAPAMFDEQVVRKSEKGVCLVGFRTQRVIVFTRTTAWAIGPQTIVCPTSMLDQIDKARDKGGKGDECGVVCNPARTVRIMDHAPCDGDASFLSIGHLEAPADTVAIDRQAVAAFEPAQGQKLAVIVAHGASKSAQPDDPKSITSRVAMLTIDQIQRDDRQSPAKLFCTSAEEIAPAIAAPVFDSTGCVVGCVEFAKKNEVQVIPIRHVAAILRSIP